MRLCIEYGIALLSVLLVGCVGPQLVRPPGQLIQLGVTTEDQVRTVLGSPARTESKVVRDNDVTIMTYTDGTRLAWFDFAGGVLVGHRFAGKCPDECPDFRDIEKTRSIVAHKSTRADVEAALGLPSAEKKYPLIDDRDGRSLTYIYFGGPLVYTEVYVTIDRMGTVQEVRTVSAKKN